MASLPAASRQTRPDDLFEKDGGSIVHVPPSAHLLPGFRAWALSNAFPEKLKVMFLKGEVYLDMSKEEIRSHAAVKTAICVALGNLNSEIDYGDLYIDGVLVTNEAADVS